MSPKKDLIIVFVKNPRLGSVKTRLAKSIGDNNALKIYLDLITHTHKVLVRLNYNCAVYYSDQIENNDLWCESNFIKYQQTGQTLGERMYDAFKNSFRKGYERVIIIGSDLPDLSTNLLQNAFKKLSENDYIIGPSKDGGYYLLGMKQFNEYLFKNKKWSTDSVLKDTIKDIEHDNIGFLPALNDIDTFEDLKHSKLFKNYAKIYN